jgi:Cu/Zn superoxide dismutase
VNKLVLPAAVLGAAVALVVAGSAVARSQATKVQVAATMVASDETPTPKGDVGTARGTFTGTLTKTDSGAVLNWQLSFTGLTGDATAAHIHIADRGKPGPVVVPLCTPCSSGASGTANVSATVLEALENDRAYVNVHTKTNPAGEIRGQASPVVTLKSSLRAAQERPKPKGRVGRARGAFTVSVTKQGSSAVLVWRLTFSHLTGKAAAAHIHKSGAHGRATVDASVITALESGRTYVNVHTKKNPAGEIRGQLGAAALTIG